MNLLLYSSRRSTCVLEKGTTVQRIYLTIPLNVFFQLPCGLSPERSRIRASAHRDGPQELAAAAAGQGGAAAGAVFPEALPCVALGPCAACAGALPVAHEAILHRLAATEHNSRNEGRRATARSDANVPASHADASAVHGGCHGNHGRVGAGLSGAQYAQSL